MWMMAAPWIKMISTIQPTMNVTVKQAVKWRTPRKNSPWQPSKPNRTCASGTYSLKSFRQSNLHRRIDIANSVTQRRPPKSPAEPSPRPSSPAIHSRTETEIMSSIGSATVRHSTPLTATIITAQLRQVLATSQAVGAPHFWQISISIIINRWVRGWTGGKRAAGKISELCLN